MSEALEAIKERFSSVVFKAARGTGKAGFIFDIQWLIERVEELEELQMESKMNLLNRIQNERAKVKRLELENERYKQALEEIANVNDAYKDYHLMWETAHKALENKDV